MVPLPSARLSFRSWAAEDSDLAEALWCDPEVTFYFGGAMTRQQAQNGSAWSVSVESAEVFSTGQSFCAIPASLLDVRGCGHGRRIPMCSKQV